MKQQDRNKSHYISAVFKSTVQILSQPATKEYEKDDAYYSIEKSQPSKNLMRVGIKSYYEIAEKKPNREKEIHPWNEKIH